jgi:hypothetical protein
MHVAVHNPEGDMEYTVSMRHESSARVLPFRGRRRAFGRRRGKGPVQFNGIHRRRQKRIRW